MNRVDALMKEAVGTGVFPGAVLLVARDEKVLFHRAYGVSDLETRKPVTPETVFDLASLTKPLAAVPVVMALMARKKLDLDDTVAGILPDFKGTDKAGITVAHLLRHTSGLPDYRPYFERLREIPPADREKALETLLAEEPLVAPVGETTLYSDLGFMVLKRIIEVASRERLDRLAAAEVFAPLGIADLFFVDLSAREPYEGDVASTERCPWRNRVLRGEVHDDNAWVMGGVAAHAGLFGTASAIHRLLSAIFSARQGKPAPGAFAPDRVRRFVSPSEDGGRALGFDVPAKTAPSCGRYFSKAAVGHLGFTGASFWVDPDRGVQVVLLSNRVHPSRENIRIREFRPRIHDAVMESIQK